MNCKLLFIAFFNLSVSHAWAESTLDARLLLRHGRFIENVDASSNLIRVDVTQKKQLGENWDGSIGFKQELEAIYTTQPDQYSRDIKKEDTYNFWLKETWLRYEGQIFSVTAGYQTVVWGEAFGTAYADLVNPKDYRELGLDTLSETRISIPLVNFQWIWGDSSLQILYLPQAEHHLLPLRGSRYSLLPDNFKVERSSADFGRNDIGLKGSFRWGTADISLFALQAADRFPVYTVSHVASEIRLRPQFKNLTSLGATLTADLSDLLLRAEVIYNLDREMQKGGAFYEETLKTNELIYVLGADIVQIKDWEVGLQYSEFRLQEKENYLFRSDVETSASLRLARSWDSDISFELLYNQHFDKNSHWISPSLTLPTSLQSEITLGADFLGGSSGTEWGDLKDSSRFFVKFVSYTRDL